MTKLTFLDLGVGLMVTALLGIALVSGLPLIFHELTPVYTNPVAQTLIPAIAALGAFTWGAVFLTMRTVVVRFRG